METRMLILTIFFLTCHMCFGGVIPDDLINLDNWDRLKDKSQSTLKPAVTPTVPSTTQVPENTTMPSTLISGTSPASTDVKSTSNYITTTHADITTMPLTTIVSTIESTSSQITTVTTPATQPSTMSTTKSETTPTEITTMPSNMSTVTMTKLTNMTSISMTMPINKTTTPPEYTSVPTNSSTIPTNSSISPSNESTSHIFTTVPPHMTSHEDTPTSNMIPKTTTVAKSSSPSKKRKFNGGSFVGGIAVGLIVTLACLGLVFMVKRSKRGDDTSIKYNKVT